MILTLIDPETRALVAGITGSPLPDERSPSFFAALDELESRFPDVYSRVISAFAGPVPDVSSAPQALKTNPAAWLWRRSVLAGQPVFDARRLTAAVLACGVVCAVPSVVSRLSAAPTVTTTPPVSSDVKSSSVPSPAVQIAAPVASVTVQGPRPAPAPDLPSPVVRVPEQVAAVPVRIATASPLTRTTPTQAPAKRTLPPVAAVPKTAVTAARTPPAPTEAPVRNLPPPPGPVKPSAQATVQRPVRPTAPPAVKSVALRPVLVAVPAPGLVQRAATKIPAPTPTKIPVQTTVAPLAKAPAVMPAVIKPAVTKPVAVKITPATDPESSLMVYAPGAGPSNGTSSPLKTSSGTGLSGTSSTTDPAPLVQDQGGFTIYTAPSAPSPKR